MLNVKIILGSTREGSLGKPVGQLVTELAKQESSWKVEVLDLKEWQLPLYNESVTPKSRETFTNEVAKRWSDKITEGEAFIIVTPEYNHGYPASLKNALDWLFKEWNRKPVAFVGYGAAAGGARAIEQLRQVVAELEMVSLRNHVLVPLVWQAFDAEGKPLNDHLAPSLKEMFTELTWWGEALQVARTK